MATTTPPSGDPSERLSIGELARATGVSVRTIRYYEERGILPKPPRSPGGTRKYPRDYRFYVEGALLLKDVGFSLEEIQLVGQLALGRRLTARQQTRAERVIATKMESLEHRIRLLERVHRVLQGETRSSPDRFAELFEADIDGVPPEAPPAAAEPA